MYNWYTLCGCMWTKCTNKDKDYLVLQVLPFLYSYQCPLLKRQSPKQWTDKQQNIPINLIIPGPSHYTQNYPLRDTTCKFLFILPFLIFWSLPRTQNLPLLMTKYLNIYLVPYFIYPSIQWYSKVYWLIRINEY